MMKMVSQLRTTSVVRALFVTLTYPPIYDAANAKRDREVFLKRLLRKYPQVAGVWRMEAQKRGAPHYHLILMGVNFIPKEWLARVWYEVVGSGNPAHLKAGTQVRRVKNYQHAVYYVAKYLSKPSEAFDDGDDGLGELGRRWGHFGSWRDHLGDFVSLALAPKEAARLVRVLDAKRLSVARRRVKGRKAAIRRARRRGVLRSQFWFGSPDFVLERIMGIIGRGSDEPSLGKRAIPGA
jgi:hypothetical protein